MIDLRLVPPAFGSPGKRLPKNFVAMTARRRFAGTLPTCSPMIASEWPRVYMFAVSMKFPPASR